MIPDLSVLWVILIVLALVGVLDRLLFRPLGRVMRERSDAIKSARELAETAAGQARAATSEFHARMKAARADLHRQMDERRRSALERRAVLLADTRSEAETLVQGAVDRVRAESVAARRALDREADTLASAVVERVLGRQAS